MHRRDFLRVSALSGTAFAMPGLAWSAGPAGKGQLVRNRKINLAAIGCGGQGGANVGGLAGENIVALCDVDFERGKSTFERWPDAKRYKDFRQMLLEMDAAIDAVVISTPDHMHFPAAMLAVTMGKHVFVEKPLTHTIEEARLLAAAARKHGVVTIMGNQGHANEGTRLVREWVQAGAIGAVREVNVWTDRPIWPQGMTELPPAREVPATLEWNRWLGVAPERHFHDSCVPFKWRGWWDFGCGALGDMGCHIMDASYWALDLDAPNCVRAETSGVSPVAGPNWAIVTYEFPARGKMPPVTLTWYEGAKRPERPKHLEPERNFNAKNGQLIVGEKGSIMATDAYCRSPRIIPEARMQEVMQDPPPKTIPRVSGKHYDEWRRAIKGQGPMPGSNFDYAGPFTETVLLGNLAMRHPGRCIEWDAKGMRCPNAPEAGKLVRKKYRVF